MDNLLAGILVSSLKMSQDTLVIPRRLSLSAHHFRGGRLPPESVAAKKSPLDIKGVELGLSSAEIVELLMDVANANMQLNIAKETVHLDASMQQHFKQLYR